MVKIPIYIGVEANQWVSNEVLKYSILKRTRAEVEFHEILPIERSLPLPKGAGFSFYRWYIPHFQKYQGRALYLNGNQVVLDDIEKLFTQKMNKPALAAPVLNPPGADGYHTSVLLFDCERLTNWKPIEWAQACTKDPELVAKTMWGLSGGLNREDLGPLNLETKIIHYSCADASQGDEASKALFNQELQEAIASEAIPLELVLREIQLGRLPGL